MCLQTMHASLPPSSPPDAAINSSTFYTASSTISYTSSSSTFCTSPPPLPTPPDSTNLQRHDPVTVRLSQVHAPPLEVVLEELCHA